MSNEQPNAWSALNPRRFTKADVQQSFKRPHSTLDWEFGTEEQAVWENADPVVAPRTPIPRTEPSRDPYGQARTTRAAATPAIDLAQPDIGARRVIATRMALDEALDQWWTNGELPALTLLRDGLLALEAGHVLDETQRSFLLRVALRRQRGMITALRYQGDPDRTAFLIKDALLDLKYPLPAKFIHELQQEDEQSAIWTDYLLHDLVYELGVAQGKRRQLAVKALAQLQGGSHTWEADTGNVPAKGQVIPLSYRWSLRWLFWALCVLTLVVGYWMLHRTTYTQTVFVPAGSYTISDPMDSELLSNDSSTDSSGSVLSSMGHMRTVVLAAFYLDQIEVTNRAYQRCYADGVCAAPSSEASATRVDYFANSVYADFPVVHVDWDAANTYCTWLGKRLPTLEEWEVAASIAPLTQRYFRYPWGERFDANFVNGASIFATDTRTVGTFHPVGDSSFGARDMAGNVAEWTASPVGNMVGEAAVALSDEFVVKGGSYRDNAELLRLDIQQNIVRTTETPWLGFRCASN